MSLLTLDWTIFGKINLTVHFSLILLFNYENHAKLCPWGAGKIKGKFQGSVFCRFCRFSCKKNRQKSKTDKNRIRFSYKKTDKTRLVDFHWKILTFNSKSIQICNFSALLNFFPSSHRIHVWIYYFKLKFSPKKGLFKKG